MKKYKIIVGGRGAECYIHRVNTDKRVRLIEGRVEEDKLESTEIAEILGIDFVTDSDDIFIGPYNHPENYYITVYDENENMIWESPNNHEFDDAQMEFKFETDQVLIVEDYIKGQFYFYEIELEKDFDPALLVPIVTEIGERVEIITDLMYNEVELSSYKEFGDYWSKGITYYLN
jgi:hypothetical protein